MAANFDISKILSLITEDENPETIDRIVGKLVAKYPQKASMLVRKMKLENEFSDSFITVTSARELSAKQKSLIEKIINKKSKSPVAVTYLVNEDLLGGIIIRRGEEVIDNTLRNRILQLSDFIKKTKFETEVQNAK